MFVLMATLWTADHVTDAPACVNPFGVLRLFAPQSVWRAFVGSVVSLGRFPGRFVDHIMSSPRRRCRRCQAAGSVQSHTVRLRVRPLTGWPFNPIILLIQQPPLFGNGSRRPPPHRRNTCFDKCTQKSRSKLWSGGYVDKRLHTQLVVRCTAHAVHCFDGC